MRVRVPPYRVALDQRVSRLEWFRTSGPTDRDLDDYLRDWDPATDLHIGVRFELDCLGFLEDVGLPDLANVRPFLGWKSRATSIVGGNIGDQLLIVGGRAETRIDAVIPGRDVGGVLELDASLILHGDVTQTSFVASRSASVLWRQQRTLGLEGDHTRFPVDVVDFSTIPGMDHQSAWYFDWDAKDLSSPVMGGMQLRVNASHPSIGGAVRTGGDVPGARIIREFLRFDTARAMILGALMNPEFSLDVDYDEGSVGEALRALVRASFPRRSLEELRMRSQTNSSDIDAEIQAFLRLLH